MVHVLFLSIEILYNELWHSFDCIIFYFQNNILVKDFGRQQNRPQNLQHLEITFMYFIDSCIPEMQILPLWLDYILHQTIMWSTSGR